MSLPTALTVTLTPADIEAIHAARKAFYDWQDADISDPQHGQFESCWEACKRDLALQLITSLEFAAKLPAWAQEVTYG